MKVLLLNGSPHKQGCTNYALTEFSKTLNEEGIESEIFQIGTDGIMGCRACGACAKLKKCAINDKVNEFLDIAQNCDGFVFGSPVYYASANGSIVSFLDRAFFANAHSGRRIFEHKPACAVASARRAGTTATLDIINKYFGITQMPVISGRYWNMVHGNNIDEVKQDLEGLQNMRILARNMAWHLKCLEAAQKAGVQMPEKEETIMTNFIR